MAHYINMVSKKEGGKLISKNISNVNPAATDEQIQDFVKVFAGLSDNTLKTAQKVIAQNLQADVTIDGTENADVLYSRRYAATIDAKGGNDLIVLDGAIKNIVNCGAGSDTVSITGGANKNTVTGDNRLIYFAPNRKNNINYIQDFTDSDTIYADSLLSYTDSTDENNVTIFANDDTLTSALVILGKNQGTLNVNLNGLDAKYKIGEGFLPMGINETYTVSDTLIVGTEYDDTLTFVNSSNVTIYGGLGNNIINGDGGSHTFQHKLGGNETITGFTSNDKLQFVNVDVKSSVAVDGDYSLQCYDSSTVLLKNYTAAPNTIAPAKVAQSFSSGEITIAADGNHITTADGTTAADGVLSAITVTGNPTITNYAAKLYIDTRSANASIRTLGEYSYVDAGNTGSTINNGGDYCTLSAFNTAYPILYINDGNYTSIQTGFGHGDWVSSVQSSGDYCTITGQNAGKDSIYSTGKCAYISSPGGNDTIYSSGEKSTVEVSGDLVTVEGANSYIRLGWDAHNTVTNTGDNVFIQGGWRQADYITNSGANVTMNGVTGANGSYWIITNTGDGASINVPGNTENFVHNSGAHVYLGNVQTVNNDATGIDITIGGAAYVENAAPNLTFGANNVVNSGDGCTITGGASSNSGNNVDITCNNNLNTTGDNCTIRLYGNNSVTLAGSKQALCYVRYANSVTGFDADDSLFSAVPAATLISENNLVLGYSANNSLTLVDYVTEDSFTPVTIYAADGEVATVIGA